MTTIGVAMARGRRRGLQAAPLLALFGGFVAMTGCADGDLLGTWEITREPMRLDGDDCSGADEQPMEGASFRIFQEEAEDGPFRVHFGASQSGPCERTAVGIECAEGETYQGGELALLTRTMSGRFHAGFAGFLVGEVTLDGRCEGPGCDAVEAFAGREDCRYRRRVRSIRRRGEVPPPGAQYEMDVRPEVVVSGEPVAVGWHEALLLLDADGAAQTAATEQGYLGDRSGSPALSAGPYEVWGRPLAALRRRYPFDPFGGLSHSRFDVGAWGQDPLVTTADVVGRWRYTGGARRNTFATFAFNGGEGLAFDVFERDGVLEVHAMLQPPGSGAYCDLAGFPTSINEVGEIGVRVPVYLHPGVDETAPFYDLAFSLGFAHDQPLAAKGSLNFLVDISGVPFPDDWSADALCDLMVSVGEPCVACPGAADGQCVEFDIRHARFERIGAPDPAAPPCDWRADLGPWQFGISCSTLAAAGFVAPPWWLLVMRLIRRRRAERVGEGAGAR